MLFFFSHESMKYALSSLWETQRMAWAGLGWAEALDPNSIQLCMFLKLPQLLILVGTAVILAWFHTSEIREKEFSGAPVKDFAFH